MNEPSATLALAAVVRRLPPDGLRSIVDSLARGELRSRALPAWLTMYVVLAMALNPGASYSQVTALVWRVLPRVVRCHLRDAPPTPAAVVRARARLGVEPLQCLVHQLSLEALELYPPNEAVVLERVPLQRGSTASPPRLEQGSLWVLRAGDGDLLAVDLQGDSIRAGVALVQRASAASLQFREVTARRRTHRDAGGVLEQLHAALPGVTIEDAGVGHGTPEGIASRNPELFAQEVLARACIELLISTEMSRALP
ncbi:transposase domain-containing protein [Streptomyces sp. NPDC004237]|uniref:transposase domain-containing protein n=1 Tax=Streptomyces sp. NPDC004237 TaxID=3154455 RepID=UPI0033BD1900